MYLLTTSSPQIWAQTLSELKEKLENASSQDERKEIILSLDMPFLRTQKEKSLPYLDTLINIGLRQNDGKAVATGLINKGNVSYYSGDLKESSALNYKALEYTDSEPEFYPIKVRIYNNLGWNLIKMEDNHRALSMFRDALKYGRLAQNDTLIGTVLNNMAVSQKAVEDYEGAMKTLTESININRRLNREEQIRFNLNNLGVVLVKMGRNEEAIDTLRKVLALNQIRSDTAEISNNQLNLGIAYYNIGKLDTANQYLDQALLTVKDDLLRRRIYLAFDNVMVSKNDYKNALNFSHKFFLLTDSLNNNESHKYMLDLESKYESIVQQRDLEKAHLNLANQRRLMYVGFGALILFIVLAIFLMYLIRNKSRNEKTLREMNEKFSLQTDELTTSNAQIKEINENLEALIKDRTTTLQKQNERLLHFTFLNSHRIRGPIASLLGLVNMLFDDKNVELETEVKQHIRRTAINLDQVVRDVTRKLEDEDIDEGYD